jgi:hypothetical protein
MTGPQTPKKQTRNTFVFAKDKHGNHIGPQDVAQPSATFLAETIWQDCTQGIDATPDWNIVNTIEDYNITRITMTELIEVLAKFKRRKAPGPDRTRMEFFKEMGHDNLHKLLETLNDWWDNENMEIGALQAKVVLIFKKGDTSNLDNYRPISFLNSIYTIFAVIIQRRIADNLDPHLQPTQLPSINLSAKLKKKVNNTDSRSTRGNVNSSEHMVLPP